MTISLHLDEILILLLKISDANGNISREDFVEFVKRSAGVKELTEKGFVHMGKMSSSSVKQNLDKAELAFKVNDILHEFIQSYLGPSLRVSILYMTKIK